MNAATTVRAFDIPTSGVRDRLPARENERIIAIGDIHGCWALLQRLIGAIETHLASCPVYTTRLVFLGDFIDRGPRSDRVTRMLHLLDTNYARATVLLGNHESAMLGSVRGNRDAQRLWIAHGGLATLASYGIEAPRESEDAIAFGRRIADAIDPEILDWMEQLPRYLHRPPFYFCHAGIRPGRPLTRQIEDDLLWIRDPFLESSRRHGAIVVHGHSVSDSVEVRHNRIGIDTGAYRTGRLSALVLEPRASWIISVDDAAMAPLPCCTAP